MRCPLSIYNVERFLSTGWGYHKLDLYEMKEYFRSPAPFFWGSSILFF